MQSRSLRVNGINMRWEENGEGRPVVFVHGIPTCPRLWRHVIPQVSGARSLAWEMVGYGGSIEVGRGRDISVARQADYLAAWIGELAVGQVTLVGHDLGGGVAQILAVRYPELVEGLVLTNSICYDSWPIPTVKAMRVMAPAVGRSPNRLFYPTFSAFLHQGHDDRGRARESVAEHWPHYEEADGAAAFVRQIRSLDVADTLAVADRIPQVKAPARIVWGAADGFQKIGYGYRLAYELGAPMDRIEGGKHWVPEDHPDRIAAAVNQLLEEKGE